MNIGKTGTFIQANASRILVASTLALLLLCAAIKTAKFDVELTSWIQKSSSLEAELENFSGQLEAESGSSNQLLLQESRDPENHTLTVHAFMVHLEALAIANQLSVDIFGVSWSLKDICFAPTLPEFGEGYNVAHLLDRIMPCAIKTPLDCFWEGAKLLGPDQTIRLRDSLPPFRWTNANPENLIEGMRRDFPHASFPYKDLLYWMKRLGIGSGYQEKPCLDPTDINCPEGAPNKRTQKSPDLGAYLTGGCHGVASKQMHWHEEEIVGGTIRNSSGHLIEAHALQSVIQLMSEHDLFEFWKKTDKVQDVNNWSTEKARIILQTWQHQFKLELAEFARTSPSAHPFKLYAITSDAALHPIQLHSLLDLYSFLIAFSLMTITTCASFPSLGMSARSRLLALAASSYVGLTFIASLGLSSFFNLPINMATTQILPPLALYYGFNQLNFLAQTFSRKLGQVDLRYLSINCLHELIPTIKVEFLTFSCTLLIAAVIPLPATRVLIFQLMLHMSLAALVTILLLPSLIILFIIKYSVDQDAGSSGKSMAKFSSDAIEEEIFSRIHEDLKNIQANARRPTNINFSAKFEAVDLHSNLESTTSRSSDISTHNLDKFNQPDILTSSSCSNLPDVITSSFPKLSTVEYKKEKQILTENSRKLNDLNLEEQSVSSGTFRFSRIYANNLAKNRVLRIGIYLLMIVVIVSLIIVSLLAKQYVLYGIQLSDIVAKGSEEYESSLAREKYFPIYNIFAVTKGNFDYSLNQKMLYEYNQALEQVDGVIKAKSSSRFWLIQFRNWLLELQQQFDFDRNRSAINADGWNESASDSAKLAYKLLVQTGRTDNPVNKGIVETNRLVDMDGIINQKAFYYYLFAWVINDPFSYAISEACFKPEHRVEKWRDDPDILKIEKPQPITYAQIPYLMHLPTSLESYQKIATIKGISQFYERQNLANLPLGIPFLFWNQFATLDLTLLITFIIIVVTIFVVLVLTSSSFVSAAIVIVHIVITSLELYGSIGFLKVPINDITVVLLLCTIGFISIQAIYYTTYFDKVDGHIDTRILNTLHDNFTTIVYSFVLFLACISTLRCSRFEFIIKYSYLLFALIVFNTFNSIFLVPAVLRNFGTISQHEDQRKQVLCPNELSIRQSRDKKGTNKKRRLYPKLNSEISLSTILEEPHNEIHAPEFKIDCSIRCYYAT